MRSQAWNLDGFRAIGHSGTRRRCIFNFVECLRLALRGTLLSFPHALDQKYLVLMGWGFIVPVVWGFSARWLPAFLAIPKQMLPNCGWHWLSTCWRTLWSHRLDCCGDDPAGMQRHRDRIGTASRATAAGKRQGSRHPSLLPSFIRIAYACW